MYSPPFFFRDRYRDPAAAQHPTGTCAVCRVTITIVRGCVRWSVFPANHLVEACAVGGGWRWLNGLAGHHSPLPAGVRDAFAAPRGHQLRDVSLPAPTCGV